MSARQTAAVGTLVADRYLLHALLGSGAFGKVWSAYERSRGGLVAVKILKTELGQDPSALLRFENEARALSLLRHPNVVALFDRGVWDDRPFLVTELVAGGSLHEWLRLRRDRGRFVALREALGLLGQACAGVSAAHQLRVPGPVVHRDLKPANLLLAPGADGTVTLKIADFNIAQVGGRASTASGAVLGSARYMAPEQAEGHPSQVGPWSDVFSLGVVLVEALTFQNTAPGGLFWWFVARTREASVTEHLRAARPDLPDMLIEALRQSLRARPEDRFADAAALQTALRDCARAAPPTIPSFASEPDPGDGSTTVVTPGAEGGFRRAP